MGASSCQRLPVALCCDFRSYACCKQAANRCFLPGSILPEGAGDAQACTERIAGYAYNEL